MKNKTIKNTKLHKLLIKNWLYDTFNINVINHEIIILKKYKKYFTSFIQKDEFKIIDGKTDKQFVTIDRNMWDIRLHYYKN